MSDAEDVGKFLLCISFQVFRGLRTYFPGLDALFLLNLRSAGLEPETALLSDPKKYVGTLIRILGGKDDARRLLIATLPRKKAFQEVIQVLLSEPSLEEMEEAALVILRKYRKDVEKECSEIV